MSKLKAGGGKIILKYQDLYHYHMKYDEEIKLYNPKGKLLYEGIAFLIKDTTWENIKLWDVIEEQLCDNYKKIVVKKPPKIISTTA